MYEDDLPASMTDAQYDAWFKKSWADFVRVGPVWPNPDMWPEFGKPTPGGPSPRGLKNRYTG